MQNHAKAVFQRHDRLQFEVCSLPTLSAPLLSKHIGSIRPHKAVPQNSASAAAWKLCSDSASEHLATYCNDQARKAEHSSLLAPTLFSLLTGKLFRELAEVVGWDRVLHSLTGYADDLTVHHTVTSWRELLQAHNMIADLLRIVRKYGFKVNADKCHLMVKLTGTASARAHKLFSRTSLDAQGVQHRKWRIGSTKAQESFPQSASFKYLGVYVSYGNQEKATLDFRLQEGNAKLQQVRRYVHNRRLSGPKAD